MLAALAGRIYDHAPQQNADPLDRQQATEMISEKTVELNLTAELLNWLYFLTKRVHTAIGPSQRMEGKLGFDVGYYGGGFAALIQYKRAYVNGSAWEWHLNRTKKRDQHARLLWLESRGVPVFYAFPHFHTVADVLNGRRRLLTATSWYPPSYIKPPGGPTGHHEVHFDSTTGKWWVSSEERVELPPPESIAAVTAGFEFGRDIRFSAEQLQETLQHIVADYEEQAIASGDDDAPASTTSGMTLVLAPAI